MAGEGPETLLSRKATLAKGERILTEPLSLLFSAVVSFSFEALAVSEEAGCVLEELPWDDLFSVSELTSLSASC